MEKSAASVNEPLTPKIFQQKLLAWFDIHGRKDLPWQHPVTPYRVWVSEIMLQQTQVTTVVPYFLAFVARFPDVESLAAADIDEVLSYWSGLGYYARARNLHKSAKLIAENGRFPETPDQLEALPGIGRSTAGAILGIAFNYSHPILDGNVKRVLCRVHAIAGWPGDQKIERQLWSLSKAYTPSERVADFTQAMMDLGATLCTRGKPACGRCPLQASCMAYAQGSVGQLPTPKPVKALPVKKQIFLLVRNSEQQVLLEKRPPIGIWGGLWSFPAFDSHSEALFWCVQRYGHPVHFLEGIEQRHTFSHYHLDFTLVTAQLRSDVNQVSDQDNILWCGKETVNRLGMPAPVKQLCRQFLEEDTHDPVSSLR